MVRTHKKFELSKFFIHFTMWVLCLIVLSTFLLVVSSSLQSEREIIDFGYRFWPKKISFEAYQAIAANPKSLLSAYWITIVTTALGAAIGTLISAGYGYALSRKDFRYRNILNWINIFSMLFNGGLVATYIVMTQWFKMKNTIWVLFLPAMYSPWNVILLKSFFSSLPFSIIEAAKIDGASEFKIFFQFVIPMSTPIIATIALFLTLQFWNDFQTSLLYTTRESLYKLQFLLQRMLADAQFFNNISAEMMSTMGTSVDIPTSNLRMAMCVVAAGPMVAVFPFFSKYFAKGIHLGGVKE